MKKEGKMLVLVLGIFVVLISLASAETHNITVSADLTAPTLSPLNGNFTFEYLNGTFSQQFTATDAGAGVSNFSVNDTTNFQTNSTGYLSNLTSLGVGTYVLNISVNDTGGNTNSTTFLVIVQDTTSPTTYQFPVSSITQTTASVIFNVSDASAIANCTAYISGSGTDNSTAINKSANNTIAITGLTAGTSYTSVANCTDVNGNIGNSSSLNFTTSSESSETTTTSGGGGAEGYPLYQITAEELAKGYTQDLRKKWQIKFPISGTSHFLTLENIFENSSQIKIESTPMEFNLSINETRYFDLDGNGKNEFKINMSGLNNLITTLTLQSIEESEIVDSGNGEVEGESKDVINLNSVFGKILFYGIIGVILGLIILVIISWIVWKFKKK